MPAAATPIEARRGEIWGVDLSPTRGREQSGVRPALVISVDVFNRGPAELVIVLPITSRPKGVPLHVRVDPPEGGLTAASYVKTEDVRSISKLRLSRRWGAVSAATLAEVEDRLRVVLGL